MGDVWKPDCAVDRHVLRAAFRILEEQWSIYGEQRDKYGCFRVSALACILIAGYHAGLRGEEISKASLAGLVHYWEESMSAPPAQRHVPLMLAGRFKGEQGVRLFCQPLTCKTKSGLEIAGWFYRHMETLKSMGRAYGSLFPNKSGEGMSIAEMDMLLHDLFCEV